MRCKYDGGQSSPCRVCFFESPNQVDSEEGAAQHVTSSRDARIVRATKQEVGKCASCSLCIHATRPNHGCLLPTCASKPRVILSWHVHTHTMP